MPEVPSDHVFLVKEISKLPTSKGLGLKFSICTNNQQSLMVTLVSDKFLHFVTDSSLKAFLSNKATLRVLTEGHSRRSLNTALRFSRLTEQMVSNSSEDTSNCISLLVYTDSILPIPDTVGITKEQKSLTNPKSNNTIEITSIAIKQP